jgi:hypothetical protein
MAVRGRAAADEAWLCAEKSKVLAVSLANGLGENKDTVVAGLQSDRFSVASSLPPVWRLGGKIFPIWQVEPRIKSSLHRLSVGI